MWERGGGGVPHEGEGRRGAVGACSSSPIPIGPGYYTTVTHVIRLHVPVHLTDHMTEHVTDHMTDSYL